MRTVLVVNDDSNERIMLSHFLESDYQVLTAESGKEMITILRESARYISAIVLDLIMPDMDGFEALRKIRENAIYRNIPAIVTTSLMEEEKQVRALSLGACGCALKPYNKDILIHLLKNIINLREKAALTNTLRKDTLTGLENRATFFEKARQLIQSKAPGYYILSCFDIENFKIVNNQYGVEVGDELLKHVAKAIQKEMMILNGICCRDAADKFIMLYPAQYENSEELSNLYAEISSPEVTGLNIKGRVGRYCIDDTSVSVSTMYDMATLAGESIKGQYDTYIAYYTDSMKTQMLAEQRIVNGMNNALLNNEFVPWFQPQFNHATGALIGAEALARWKSGDRYISPGEFIPAFERNGFIYEMDKAIWKQVCLQMRQWLDDGKNPLPVSVNISRCDLFHKDFMSILTGLLKEFDLPYDLIRLEVTESALGDKPIIGKVGELIKLGFTVEIDDFGSGYSSLNTLKDVPASILKLDMRFFENSGDSQRGGNIVESVVRMAKWLGMAVIAEGVETKAQADYLKSIGCYYIQGYYYAKPMPFGEYEKLLSESKRESELTRLQTIESIDNNQFWNPESMDSLIFSSYIGAACILEYTKGYIELIRISDSYMDKLESTQISEKDVFRINWAEHLEDRSLQAFDNAVMESIQKKKTINGEFVFTDLPGCPGKLLMLTGLRVIARVGERILIYCLNNEIVTQK